MLAGDGAAHADAPRKDRFAAGASFFQVAGFAGVEENDGVQVAIAGVKDVADGESVLAGGLADEIESGRDLGARHHAILHVIGGADAAHGAKGVFAALPEQIALLGGAGHAKFARAAEQAGFANLLDLRFHGLANAFEFDEQHGGGIHGIARVRGFFHHAEHDAIQHLDRDRGDGAGGDFGHGAARVFAGFVNSQDSFHQFGFAHQPDGHLGDQGHGAFGAGEQAREVVAGQVGQAAGLNHFAMGQHQFQAQYVVGGDPVGQSVRAAGVFGHVAADGAGALAGRVGRIEVAAAFHGSGDIEIDHARLHHGALVFEIDFQNAVHAGEGDHHASLARNGAAGKPGPGAAPYEGDAEFGSQLDQRRDV